MFNLGVDGVFCASISLTGIGGFGVGWLFIFILNGGERKLSLGTDIFRTPATYIGRRGFLNMCHYVFVFLVAAAVAHLIPKQSHYTFQGVGVNGKYIQWVPNYKDLHGMIWFHAFGNCTLSFDNINVEVSNVRFFHAYGHMPDMLCESESGACKVVAHLIT